VAAPCRAVQGSRRGVDSPALSRPRRPAESVLYRGVQEPLETYLARARAGYRDADPVPGFVERDFRRYLACGILAQGFARARGSECGHEVLIAFSCQGRGVCPCGNARRRVRERSAPGGPRLSPPAGAPMGSIGPQASAVFPAARLCRGRFRTAYLPASGGANTLSVESRGALRSSLLPAPVRLGAQPSLPLAW
jgi:hypothetical protein